MHVTENEKKLIEKFKNKMEAFVGSDKVKLFLFGSKTRGDADHSADTLRYE